MRNGAIHVSGVIDTVLRWSGVSRRAGVRDLEASDGRQCRIAFRRPAALRFRDGGLTLKQNSRIMPRERRHHVSQGSVTRTNHHRGRALRSRRKRTGYRRDSLPQACAVTTVIEITHFAFSPPAIPAGQMSTATLTALNCTAQRQQTSGTWSGASRPGRRDPAGLPGHRPDLTRGRFPGPRLCLHQRRLLGAPFMCRDSVDRHRGYQRGQWRPTRTGDCGTGDRRFHRLVHR